MGAEHPERGAAGALDGAGGDGAIAPIDDGGIVRGRAGRAVIVEGGNNRVRQRAACVENVRAGDRDGGRGDIGGAGEGEEGAAGIGDADRDGKLADVGIVVVCNQFELGAVPDDGDLGPGEESVVAPVDCGGEAGGGCAGVAGGKEGEREGEQVEPAEGSGGDGGEGAGERF